MRDSRSNSRPRFRLRFSLAVALLAATGLFLQVRGSGVRAPERRPLAKFPGDIQGWTARTIPIPSDIRAVLGPGEFIERLYSRLGSPQPVDLFLAYFPSQRAGDTMHSPKNCLPGGGWTPIASTEVSLAAPGGKPFLVNRYLIAKGIDRMLVFYWFQEQGRPVASEYWAKVFLVAGALRDNRTDGALIRIATPIGDMETPQIAQERIVAFAGQVLPLLHSYLP
jgi:EpsI family protein